MGILLFAIVFLLLLIFSEIDKWWLWFIFIGGILAHYGFELRMGGLIVAVLFIKVVKDICNQL